MAEELDPSESTDHTSEESPGAEVVAASKQGQKPSNSPPTRAWWKRKRVWGGTLLFVVVAVATLPWWLAPWVARRVEQELAAKLPGAVSVQGLSFAWSGSWSLDQLRVASPEGAELLSIRGAEGAFAIGDLVSGQLVGNVNVEGIDLSVTRTPSSYEVDLLEGRPDTAQEVDPPSTTSSDPAQEDTEPALSDWPFQGEVLVKRIRLLDSARGTGATPGSAVTQGNDVTQGNNVIAEFRLQIDRAAGSPEISAQLDSVIPAGVQVHCAATPEVLSSVNTPGPTPRAKLRVLLQEVATQQLVPPELQAELQSKGFTWSETSGGGELQWYGGVGLRGQMEIACAEVSCKVPTPAGERVARFTDLTWSHTSSWDITAARGSQVSRLYSKEAALVSAQVDDLGGTPRGRMELALAPLNEWGAPLLGFREGLDWYGAWEVKLDPSEGAESISSGSLQAGSLQAGSLQARGLDFVVKDSDGRPLAVELPQLDVQWSLASESGQLSLDPIRLQGQGLTMSGDAQRAETDGYSAKLLGVLKGEELRAGLGLLFEEGSRIHGDLAKLPAEGRFSIDIDTVTPREFPIRTRVDLQKVALAEGKMMDGVAEIALAMPEKTATGWSVKGETDLQQLRMEGLSQPLDAKGKVSFSGTTDSSGVGLRLQPEVTVHELDVGWGNERFVESDFAITLKAALSSSAFHIQRADVTGADFSVKGMGTLHLDGERSGELEDGMAEWRAKPLWLQSRLAPFVELEWISSEELSGELRLSGPLGERPGRTVNDDVPWAFLTGTTGSALLQVGTFRLQEQGRETWLVGTTEDGLPLQWGDGHLKLLGALEINEGQVRIDGDFDLRSAGAPLGSVVKVDATDVRLNAKVIDLLRRVHPLFAVRAPLDGFLGGRVDSRLDFEYRASLHSAWRAKSWKGLPKEPWSGTGHVEVHDFALKEAPVVAQLLSALKVDQPEGVALNPIDFTVERGRLRYDRPMQLKIDAHTTLWTGSIGLDESLDLMWKIPITEEWAGRRRELRSFVGQSLDIPVTGTSKSPRVDWSGVIGQLASKGIEGALDGAINKGLNDLFGGGGNKGESAADLLQRADQLWKDGKRAEAAGLYGKIRKEHRKSLIYRLNKSRIKKRMVVP